MTISPSGSSESLSLSLSTPRTQQEEDQEQVQVKHKLWPILLGLLPPSHTQEEFDLTMDKLTSSYSELLASCQSLEKEILLGPPKATNHELKAFAEVLRVTTTDAVRSNWKKNSLSCFVPPQSGFFSSLTVPDWVESSSMYKKWEKGGSELEKVKSKGEGLESHHLDTSTRP